MENIRSPPYGYSSLDAESISNGVSGQFDGSGAAARPRHVNRRS
jgi:hypothetical protein